MREFTVSRLLDGIVLGVLALVLMGKPAEAVAPAQGSGAVVVECDEGGTVAVPCRPSGYDGGAVAVEATPANSSHAAGTSIGGLFTIPLPRSPTNTGIATNLLWKSIGGSTGALAIRVWQQKPLNTICTDNVAYSTSAETDDRELIVPPIQTITPSVAASTTGDSATYAWLQNLVVDYKSTDGNIYVCAVTVATDTADESHLVRLTLSGPQN